MQLSVITEAVEYGLTANPVVAQAFAKERGWSNLPVNEVCSRNLLRHLSRSGFTSVALEGQRAGRNVLVDFRLLPGGRLA